MPMEKKKKTPEEIAFNKRWGKISKLNPSMRNLDKNIGKAPRCNSSSPKKTVEITVANKKKK